MSAGALIMGRDLRTPCIQTTYGSYFESIEELPAITILQGGRPAFELSVFLAHERNVPDRPDLLGPLALGRH